MSTFKFELTIESFERFCREIIPIRYKKALEASAATLTAYGITPGALQGPFILNDKQRECATYVLTELAAGRPVNLIILKARQIGFSTLIAALFLFLTHLKPGLGTLVLAQDSVATEDMTDGTYRTMIEGGDPAAFMKATPCRGGWKFPNKSRVTIRTAGTKTVAMKIGSGTMNHLVHGSEMSKWAQADATALSVGNTWAGNEGAFAVLIWESSANARQGIGQHFYEAWCKARDGESTAKPWFVGWQEFKEYRVPVPAAFQAAADRVVAAIRAGKTAREDDLVFTALDQFELDAVLTGLAARKGEAPVPLDWGQILWRRKTIAGPACGGSLTKFDQDYPWCDEVAFEVSGKPMFEGSVREILTALRKEAKSGQTFHIEDAGDVDDATYGVKAKLVRGIGDGMFELYHMPTPGHEYIVTCDAADQGDCYSATEVLDRHTGEICLTAMHRGTPSIETARLCVALGYIYNTAMQAIERASGGIAVVDIVFSILRYPKVVMTHPTTQLRMGDRPLTKPGWETKMQSKDLLKSTVDRYLLSGFAKIECPIILDQMLGWQKGPDGKPAKRQQTDALMACMIAYRVHEEFGDVTPLLLDGTEPEIPSLAAEDAIMNKCHSVLEEVYKRQEAKRGVNPWDDTDTGGNDVEDSPWD